MDLNHEQFDALMNDALHRMADITKTLMDAERKLRDLRALCASSPFSGFRTTATMTVQELFTIGQRIENRLYAVIDEAAQSQEHIERIEAALDKQLFTL